MAERMIIDTHVHLYPFFDLIKAFRGGAQNLMETYRTIAYGDLPPTALVWILTEREPFRMLERLRLAPPLLPDSHFRACADQKSLRVVQEGVPNLYLLPGSQLVTREGLELLSLCTDLRLPDRRLPISEAIETIRLEGGIPVLNWAPGKWLFRRGKIMRRLLHDPANPSRFLIGDTPLRPRHMRMPPLMRTAKKRGFRIIGGSDPLPLPDEERQIGRYGILLLGPFDPDHPNASVKKLLEDPLISVSIAGRRNDFLTAFKREILILFRERARITSSGLEDR